MLINRYFQTLIFFFCVSFMLANGQNVVKSDTVRAKNDPELKEAFQDKFYIGTTLNTEQIMGGEPKAIEVVKNHFNSIVAENVMKSERIQPREGEFNFALADKFVEFGEQNDMHIHGHTLIWHSQAPDWFFEDKQGDQVSKEVLVNRMKDHIYTVVGRYKGKVHSWDVVNEAILDDGSFRESKFFEILGEDFIKLAFQFAHEADPGAKLFYNDYSMANPGKRDGVVIMVKKLKEEGIPVHGIGMQGHIGLKHPAIEEFEKSIEAFGKLGEVMITELDLSVLPSPRGNAGAEISDNYEYEDKMNPFKEGLPDSVAEQFSSRYLEFFELFLKHRDVISRVALWGVNDGNSWKNNWPVRGRTDYPLLFDRENNPKPVVRDIIGLAVKNNSSFTASSQSNFSSNLIGSGVVVSDLERSLDFYVDGIGMVKTYSFTINEDFSIRSGLSNGVPTDVTVLKLENSPEANEWKLMSFGKKPTDPKPEFIQDDTGVQYITINVKALKPVMERLKQKNIPFLGNTPTPLNQDLSFVLVQDPDGIFIELIGPME